MKRWMLGLGLVAMVLTWGLAWGQADTPTGKAVADTAKKAIDINTATAQELDGLPGIGKAYTKAIIEGRPYKDKLELLWKKIVPKGTYGKIKDKIIAVQPKPVGKANPPAPPVKEKTADKSSPKIAH